jgi:hypothetical protein
MEVFMRRIFAVSIALAACAFGAQAQEGIELANRAKSFAVTTLVAPSPPVEKMFAPSPDVVTNYQASDALARQAANPLRPRAACELTKSDLCFDMKERRAVYRGVREYMPSVEGLRPESVSLKREGIVLKYSFK